MRKLWSDKAWDDYVYWQSQDKKTLKRINSLIKSIERTSSDPESDMRPIGKAERLKHSEAGLMSVRIDARNRIVYRVEEDDTLLIISCRGHYE